MTVEEAADFLRMNLSEFKRPTATGETPRHGYYSGVQRS